MKNRKNPVVKKSDSRTFRLAELWIRGVLALLVLTGLGWIALSEATLLALIGGVITIIINEKRPFNLGRKQ